jgi:hypothetical protein
METFVATFLGAQRCKRLSRNGNPSYDVITSEGTFRTETDGSIGYSIPNYTNTRLSSSLIGKKAKFHVRRNRITYIEEA